ncbi:MAG: ABC transporter permease subunit [Hyphomicrobiaceae bacterium]|nr:ABC transporter permease subunit [Hyphomicrobiaceae bacterium]
MSSRSVFSALMGVYILVFFAYLFGPLVVMGLTAFNTPAYPQVYPFEAFTLDWFATLFADADMMYGLRKSVLIGVLVVLVSVPVGLAGAMMMTQVHARARSFYYLVVVSPVLTPGVIIGISTVVFWRQTTQMTGLKFFYDGTVLTVLAQSSFISAYTMLIFLARLQRFDHTLEEAALDLGASRAQVFRNILIPFMMPAIGSASAIAFLSSFENYNTTTFAILADKTLVTVLAGRLRQGTTPALSALAVTIVAVTVCGAILYEYLKRREAREADRRALNASRAELADLNAVAQDAA